MKPRYLIFLFLIYPGFVFPGERIDSVNISDNKYFLGIGIGDGGGPYGGDFVAYRLSYQKILSISSKYNFKYLSDTALNIWDNRENDLTALQSQFASSSEDSSNLSITYSRILRKYVTDHSFLDIGLGLSIHNNDSIGGADLGSNYQFESRFGLGYERDRYRSVLNLFHYSNGDTKGENDGVNIFMLSISKFF